MGSGHHFAEVAHGWWHGSATAIRPGGTPKQSQPRGRSQLHPYPGLWALPLSLLLLLQGGYCGPLLPHLGTDHLRGRSQPSRVTHSPCWDTHISHGCTQPHMGVHKPVQAYTTLHGMHNPVWAHTNRSVHNLAWDAQLHTSVRTTLYVHTCAPRATHEFAWACTTLP